MSLKYVVCCLCFLTFLLQAKASYNINLGQQDFFEGDIIKAPKKNRNGILQNKKWTDGIVYYENIQKWNQTQKEMLAKAMKDIEDHTCIRFQPYTNQVNFIRIINDTGCYASDVGMSGGLQYMSLMDKPNGGTCWTHGTIVHELLHIVGLEHEHQRYDREDYVTIRYENVQKGMKYAFTEVSKNVTSTYDVPYNYLSIMHYDKYAFSDGAVTIETKDIGYANWIGKTNTAAESDYEKVRRIYQCKGQYSTMPTPTTMAPGLCEDTMKNCAYQLGNDLSKCRTEWWAVYCRQTCGFCTTDCKDEIEYCLQYSNKCSTEVWMKDHCKKTCHFCEPN